jgi:hypothetical protein
MNNYILISGLALSLQHTNFAYTPMYSTYLKCLGKFQERILHSKTKKPVRINMSGNNVCLSFCCEITFKNKYFNYVD